jgi:hypothetical protein
MREEAEVLAMHEELLSSNRNHNTPGNRNNNNGFRVVMIVR